MFQGIGEQMVKECNVSYAKAYPLVVCVFIERSPIRVIMRGFTRSKSGTLYGTASVL